jgi:hypothetical protein
MIALDVCVRVLALVAALAAQVALGAAGTEGVALAGGPRLTRPDRGTHAEALERVLRHPSMDPGRGRVGSRAARAKFVGRVLASYDRRGAQASRDPRVQADLDAALRRVLPAVQQRFGVQAAARLRVLSRGGGRFEARALPDESILVHRSDVEYARSIARAVAAAGDEPALLANLARVARSVQQGRMRVTFGRTDPRKYRATLDGVLVGLLGHEVTHLVARHAHVDFAARARTVVQRPLLERRLDAYLGAGAMSRYDAQQFVDGRLLLEAQAQEADADRAAVDLVLASGIAPDGMMADYIVAVMLQGLDRDAVGSHPPERHRFEDARARLARAGMKTFADRIDLADVERAARRAGVTRRQRGD